MQKKESKEKVENEKEKLLLHACCAVCAAHPFDLLNENFDTTIYFFNPNIYPEKEYLIRRDELINYCEQNEYKYIVEEYEHDRWLEYIKGFESEPEKGARCDKCFDFRLLKTAQKANSLGIKNFTTTLTVSPHKISKNVFASGQKAAQLYGLNFLEYDFKKQDGFLKTMQIAKKNAFYRQQYCGCEFSIRKIEN